MATTRYGFSVDVEFAPNYGFDHSNYPSYSPFDPPLLGQGTTARTPRSSSSTRLSPGTRPAFTEPPAAPPSPKGVPQALQPKRGLQCPACQKVVSCSALLRSHKCNTKRFLCDFEGCKRGPKGFTSQKDLNRHQQTIHADKALAPRKVQVCQVCSYETRRSDHFKRHQERHHR